MTCENVSESCKKKYASVPDIIATILIVVGALNWGLYAILGEGKDLVSFLANAVNTPVLAKVVFIAVAVAGMVKAGYLVSYAL